MTTVNPPTITLDDASLVLLLEEVSAMANSGRTIAAGMAGLDDRSMGKLGRAANAVRAKISRGESATESIAELSSNYQAPVRIAMEVMAETGSTESIHEAARLIRHETESRHQLMMSSINPMLNLIVSAAITFLVIPWILVNLSEAQLIKSTLSPTIGQIVEAFAKDVVLASVVALAVVGICSCLLYWGLSRCVRGAKVFRDQATFCRWLAMQLNSTSPRGSVAAAGPDLGRAVGAAAQVVGPAFAKSWAGAIDNIRGGAKMDSSLEMPSETPPPVQQCVVDLASASRDDQLIAYDLRRLADLYTQKSRRHQIWWAERLPRWITWVLMITMMVVLLRTIVMPILDVIGGIAF